jgi:hypothetical protein
MPKVYITQDLGVINFVPAEAFGELVVVIDRRISHVGLKRAYAQMRERMRHIVAEDWIVPSGHPTLIAYAGYLMGESTGLIRMLAWDGQTNKYIQTEVETRK